MNRRDFLRSTSFAVASLALSKGELSFAQQASADVWRKFEVTTRAEVLKPAGATKVWLPAALIQETAFQKTISNRFSADGGEPRMVESSPATPLQISDQCIIAKPDKLVALGLGQTADIQLQAI